LKRNSCVSNNYIIGADNGASSTYHGLLTKLERRFSNGFALLFSYTSSHVISDASSSSNFDNTPSNPQCRCDWKSEKGPAAFDIRLRASSATASLRQRPAIPQRWWTSEQGGGRLAR
jgi:hypothetical protein